jgi:hypothetical protein
MLYSRPGSEHSELMLVERDIYWARAVTDPAR